MMGLQKGPEGFYTCSLGDLRMLPLRSVARIASRMTHSTGSGAGYDDEPLHANLRDAIQDTETKVLCCFGDEPSMCAAQEHDDGVPTPRDNRQPLQP
mmetsp:Transcript_81806/g.165602  ORF Transcript_81806/g.165602 Transcript_81806/m.165602 type:complete len:97 (-) Transcript_81806:382-672(-)